MTAEWIRASNVHTDLSRRHVPHSVLLFAGYRDAGIVWVRHPSRGWEVPGGKVEPYETPQAALEREAFEEAGIRLVECEWLAEYEVERAGEPPIHKWVYTATAASLEARPAGFEIVDVIIAPMRTPMDVALDPAVSPILQDDMYVSLYPLLRDRLE